MKTQTLNFKKGKPLSFEKRDMKQALFIFIAVAVFALLFFGLPASFDFPARMMTSIVCFGIILWALEPIPLGLTAVIILLFMLIFQVAESDVVFSGFASPAMYLIVGGMMLAEGVNETPLAKRVTYKILQKWGRNEKGLLGSLFIIPQIQAFFIPATIVRTALIMPVVRMIIKTVDAKPGSNLRKMILIGVAFSGIISGTAVMTAAVGNILTVELLKLYAGINITYFQWMLYTFPLWLILIPTLWYLILKIYPLSEEERSFPKITSEMDERLRKLGKVEAKEIRCLIILIITVALWMSEPLHGLHPSIPALMSVVLMTLPWIGCTTWDKVVKINYNTILLIGVTLSMGYSLIDTGAIKLIGDYLSMPWVLHLMKSPVSAVIFIVILTQLFHKMISNVSTAVVTLIPIVLAVATKAGADPLLLGLTTGLTSLFGFLLAVETMPGLLIHGTGMISQKDFLKPGFYATLITSAATILLAVTWWKWIGFL